MKDFLEDVTAVICVIPIVLGMGALYWVCRLCGVRLEDDF